MSERHAFIDKDGDGLCDFETDFRLDLPNVERRCLQGKEAAAHEEAGWDKEAVYDEQISPLMAKIIAVCKEHEIPLVAQFQYAHIEEENDEGNSGAQLCTTVLTQFERTCPELRRLALQARASVAESVVFAETITKRPDGGTDVSIRRIR